MGMGAWPDGVTEMREGPPGWRIPLLRSVTRLYPQWAPPSSYLHTFISPPPHPHMVEPPSTQEGEEYVRSGRA